MDRKDKLIVAISVFVLGILFITLDNFVPSITLTVFGALIILMGLLDILQQNENRMGAIKISIGVVFVVLSWIIPVVMIVVFGIALILFGIYQMYEFYKPAQKSKDVLSISLQIALPVLSIASGIMMFFNIDATYMVAGILLLIESAVIMINEYIFNN